MIRQRVNIPLSPLRETEFVSFAFPDHVREDIAILFKGWDTMPTPLVRVHSECLTGDVFHSLRCDCRAQLDEAMELCATDGGVIIYLRQEGRDIGLYNKLDAYHLQDNGFDTFTANEQLGLPVDGRKYDIAARMLKDLGIPQIRLITNNPAKISGLSAEGIEIVEALPTEIHATAHNQNYLKTKSLSGHRFKEKL